MRTTDADGLAAYYAARYRAAVVTDPGALRYFSRP